MSSALVAALKAASAKAKEIDQIVVIEAEEAFVDWAKFSESAMALELSDYPNSLLELTKALSKCAKVGEEHAVLGKIKVEFHVICLLCVLISFFTFEV